MLGFGRALTSRQDRSGPECSKAKGGGAAAAAAAVAVVVAVAVVGRGRRDSFAVSFLFLLSYHAQRDFVARPVN